MPATTMPSHSIYENLRNRLITAEFPGGFRMKPDELRAPYDCSASTMREVLFRLSCDGFLNFIDQRGFHTPNPNPEKMIELAQMRIMLEQAGARHSIAHSTLEWEARLTAAQHKLAHIETAMQTEKSAREHVGIWTAAEREFHMTLVSLSPNSLLKSTHVDFFDRFRQLLVINNIHGNFGYRAGNITEHSQIVDTALSGDADACCAMLKQHVESSMIGLRGPHSLDTQPKSPQ
ncbi:GntR family transcriptional regulator [Amylibacter marinus]|uniref:GntR family transcriptional regulator n=1 Tax=Amylibacter marinus TaxID=1475483 RepID=A0ABQ5VWK4_9RHOB|nr:GntR family transcriptional regulator [Amylibacter marinus]GLQ35802.1 GntR family transcriptional regulator [Amylibacter marinus]